MLRTVRNVAIVALVAVPVAFLPGGGDAAETVLTALVMGFLAALGYFAYRLYRDNELTLATMPDSRRGAMLAAAGVIALMIAAQDEMLDSGAGTLLWIILIGLSAMVIVLVVTEARSL